MERETYYLAIDVGENSGRHILGRIENGKIVLEEVYRFETEAVNKYGHRCWNLDQIFHEILTGIKKCKEIGKIPSFLAIDTWAVDYVLIGERGEIVGDTYGYRDSRTEGTDKLVDEILLQDELYQRTGIQKQKFNTIYQLVATREQEPEVLEQAEKLLLLPDYYNYLLTGVMKTEYTNATTTQLIKEDTKNWDWDMIGKLAFPLRLFGDITMAGTVVGNLTEEMEKEAGFQVEVIQTASQDTASAVVGVPAVEDDFLYISSGTWSLMGIEQDEAVFSEEGRKLNYTNEGGYDYHYRYLKNIMGLWMIQQVRHEFDDKYSFEEFRTMAAESDITSVVDVNDERFLAPESMIQMLKDVCREEGQQVPETPGELAKVIYHSLAKSYDETAKEIEKITGKQYPAIYIVGGGVQETYLCQITADITGKKVYAGPVEGTAVGNLLVQMIKDGRYKDLKEARKAAHQSFDIKCYVPGNKGTATE